MSGSERSKTQEPAAAAQADGDERMDVRGLFRAAGVNGVLFGANGEAYRHFVLGVLAFTSLLVISNTINVLTIFHDEPDLGVVAPIIWEASSAGSFLLALWIPWLALRLAPLDIRRLWRIAAFHMPAVVLFSLLHVAGFVLIRQAIYVAMGSHYGYSPLTEDFLYELRKDARSYIFVVAIFWGVGQFLRARARETASPAGPAVYDIRDGARLTRVSINEILAVTSADNYVEFVLADGRRLMMRKSLSAIESELAARGFLRTHRSWLINAARMTALKPEGSGDYTVELGSLTVPLSRRFPEALAKLRAG
jgi:DNA-binding LytR/AlgR family response regulator